MLCCCVPLGHLPCATSGSVFSLGGVFASNAAAVFDSAQKTAETLLEDEDDAEEASAEVLRLSLDRSWARLGPGLHQLVHSRHPSWFRALWRARASPALLRRTCVTPQGSTVWRALLLNANDADAVPLLCACMSDVPAWMSSEFASPFLCVALQHAHPAAAHALGRRVCKALRQGEVDTSFACVRHVVLALARTRFPMLIPDIRAAAPKVIDGLLAGADRDALLGALVEISCSADLIELLRFWRASSRPCSPAAAREAAAA